MIQDLSQAKRLIKKCLETQNPRLDLGNCGITDLDDLPELFECTHLKELILSSEWWFFEEAEFRYKKHFSQNQGPANRLQSVSIHIKALINLEQFMLPKVLPSGEIINHESLAGLPKLQYLVLGYNKITDLSFLEKLTQIRSLDLRYNQIADLSFLEKLTQLRSLDLSYNQIADLSFLEKLTQLQSLYLRSNQITDPSSLEKLTQIRSLDLSSNQIAELSFLEKLTQLQSLYLRNNQIADLSFLENLTQIHSLDLRNNQIADLSSLENLTQIHSLDLRNNQIASIPQAILNRFISYFIGEYFSGQGLGLNDNPIVSPPIKTLKKGRKEVLKYFADLEN